MFLKKSKDTPNEWVVMANETTPAGWVKPARKHPWGEQEWGGVVIGGTVACDDAYDRDEAAQRVMDVWREQEDASAAIELANEDALAAAEREQLAAPERPGRGRPEIGPRFQMRLSQDLRERVEAAARPGEKLADTIRRLLAAALSA